MLLSSEKDKYIPYGDQYIDTRTGEIIELHELSKVVSKNMIDTFCESSGHLINMGVNVPFRIVKTKIGKSSTINVKESYHFAKIFKVDVRDMMIKTNLTVHAKAFIYTCLCYLYFPSNTVIVNGKNPDIKELCDIVGIGKSKLYEVLDELEENDVIKREKINGCLVIYFNPFLHSCGLVDKYTHDLFQASIYNHSDDECEG